MSGPAENSEQGPALPSTPEGLLAFLQENSRANPGGRPSPLTSVYDFYRINVPEHRVPDVGFDFMTVFLSQMLKVGDPLSAEPDSAIAAVATIALDDAFHPIDLPRTMAEWYYVVTTDQAGKLAVVKTVGPKVSDTEAKVERKPAPNMLQSSLGRLSLRHRHANVTASQQRVVMGYPVAEADSLDIAELFDLAQEGIRSPRFREK